MADKENNKDINKTTEKDFPPIAGATTPESHKIEPEKTLFTWKAPERPFKKRGKDFWVTVITIASLFGIIMFFAEGAMPVILIVSLVFLFYIMSTVEPQEIMYSITNRGVKIVDRTTEWQYLTRFWFSRRFDSSLLVFEMNVIPGRLEVVIDEKDKAKIKDVVKDYVLEEEVPPSRLDNAANWFAKKLPGN